MRKIFRLIYFVITILFTLNIKGLYCIEQIEQLKYFELIWEKKFDEKAVAITDYKGKNINLLYIVFENGKIQALNKDYATEVWKFSADQKIKFTPALIDNKIFFGTNKGTIYSLDAATGSKKWESKVKKSISASSLFHQEKIYIGSLDNNLYTFNADNGELLWKFKTDGAIAVIPQIFENIVFISSMDGHVYAVDSTDGTELWEINTGWQGTYFPLVIDKKNSLVFISSNDKNIYAIEPKSGEVIWNFSAQQSGLHSGMILAENMLFVPSYDGMLYSIDVRDGKLKWNIKIGTFLPVNPPVQGETFFIATERGEIIALNINDGNIKWINKIAERFQKSPLLFENIIFLASDQGYLYGLDILSGNKIFKYNINYYPDYLLYYDYNTHMFYYFSINNEILAFEKIEEESENENIEDTTYNREYITPPFFSSDGKFGIYNDAGLFEKDHNLYRIEFIDSTRRIIKLTSSAYDDISPQWLLDSTAILFSSNRNGIYNIYKMDMTKLDIFYYDDNKNNECTRKDNTSSEDLLKLTPEEVEKKYLTILTEEAGDKINPISSPDGNKILYSSNMYGNWDLCIMDSTGQNRKRLTYTKEDEENASFSPDSKKIVYVTFRFNNKHINTIDIDGTNEYNLTNDETDNINPGWINDSTIVYEKINKNNKSSLLWLVNKDGTNDRQLTSGNFRDCYPSPSPDGKTIAFLSNRKNRRDNIWITNLSGKGMAQISNFADEVHPVSWSKDGNKLILFIKNKAKGEKYIKLLENINKESVQGFFIQAENLVRDGKYNEAQEIYESIISEYPDQKIMVYIEPSFFNLLSHATALYKISKIEEIRKDFEQMTKIKQIIAEDINNDYDDKKMFSIAISTRIQLLEQEFKNGKYKETIEGYEKILHDFPKMNNEYGYPLSPYINIRIAECYEKLKKYEQAITVYKKNYEQNPSALIMFNKDYIGTTALNYLNIARIYETQYNYYNNALDNYFEILKKYPDDKFFTVKGEFRGEYSQKAISKIREIYSTKQIDINNWLNIFTDFNKTLQDGKIKTSVKYIINDLEQLKNGKTIKRPMDQLNKILFASRRPGKVEENNYEIYSINDDGSELKRLTFNNVNDYRPVWSKDGLKIAYHTIFDNNYEIFLMDYDGTNQTNLTNTQGCYDFEPSWSYEGSRLSFTSDRDGNMEIYVMNQDGSEPTNITKNPARDFESNWSPTSDKIVFSSNRDGNLEVYLFDFVSGTNTNLTNSSADDHAPSFSPDGSKILFTSNRDGNEEIYVMKIDGSEQENLSNSPSYDYDAVWSSDGKNIIFVSNRDNITKIFIMNADGTHQVKLTDDPESCDIQPNELLIFK